MCYQSVHVKYDLAIAFLKCERLRENLAYGIRVQFAFLVSQVEKCQRPDFVISMPKNPSSVPVYRR